MSNIIISARRLEDADASSASKNPVIAKVKSFLPTALFFFFAVMAMMSAILWPRGSYLLVVAPPFSSPAATMAIIASADGAFVQQGTMSWVAIAYSQHPDFATRLRSAGALVVLGSPLQNTCLTIASTGR
ncbi:hypothetical protein HGO34_02890 [Agrobacterium vitis]|uniref:Uncharacterized protein n=1 Tax=Agrobacterium vitis TaxID=373 RepID=A0AAE4W9M0_AGRVI|nr:hypothetical protein [Agrobacterium vitis]MCF1497868.1 hypothetical protein [Allorhizobium sp. Av2]MCM2438666.1 hypothetical protein [Agrobacterium vitis]MUZ56008.1 hypothetical protein [Agrobacterium vitis]MVA64854.1 hypothetical protein [Agrobacterium vitis]MVA85825.1 hypothetical protein [Agrobacterium vitis]